MSWSTRLSLGEHVVNGLIDPSHGAADQGRAYPVNVADVLGCHPTSFPANALSVLVRCGVSALGDAGRSGWPRMRCRVIRTPRDGKNRDVRVMVTRDGGKGASAAPGWPAGRDDAARWEELIEQASLGVPPPYRPRPGEAVYHIGAGELEVQVASGT